MGKEFVKELINIFILGRGFSLTRCPVEKPEKSEYWGCNNIYRVRDVDRLFIMHDLYATQFNRESNIIQDVNEKDFPVYTLGKYEILKNNIQYPMEEVIKEFDIAYFTNNISYMLALAIIQKPKNIIMFGVDMAFGNKSEYMREEKANVEFWMGVAVGRKIKIQIAKESTLLKRVGRTAFYWMKESIDEKTYTLNLEPQYLWNRPKCAAKYKIVKLKNIA